ncbi:hypothetical protein [Mesorhizobium sp. M8A.F.Ca.ET.021.01.1.1]|uniref:hypothetical protein n=1 Tax=Mesorhizobium sp. M8A.F.Ca.ET.021.01.1.1 TaxID=2496757 RepID=UPI000FCC3431|nr:hypothetical protein [Mesorhizobium sp. M8A.F.Ca.ET.021.01.1.1]RUW57184.1 hypothetical protein EOA36_00960 [Mesorhizobium sp. M8A.F.Ca.ET.021.01.1.1]
MTVLVYRDGVLASDSQLIRRNWHVLGSAEKIARVEVDGQAYLVGGTGEAPYVSKFIRWCRSADFPKFLKNEEFTSPHIEPTGKDDNCTGFVIKPDGICIRFEGDDPPYEVTAEWHVFGSGDQFAVGALEMKATAEEACAVAIKQDLLSAGPMQVVRR